VESQVLTLNIFAREMSPYALLTWVGAIAALIVFLICAGRTKVKGSAIALTVVLGIPLALLCARAYYVLARLDFFMSIGLNQFFRTDDEELRTWGAANGAAFWGAVGGAALGAWIAAKATKEKTGKIMDALAPGAALGIFFSRLGEYSIGEGIGPDVSVEGLCFFPIAVVNEWEEWRYSVFLLEAVVALVIFMLLVGDGRKKTDGYRARMFLILYASTQIVLESLRRDNFLRWLFVRVSQVVAAVVLLFLVIAGIIRWTKKDPQARMPKGRVIACTAVFVLLAGVIILLEFAIDKSATLSVGMAYLLETICCAGMGVCAWQVAMKN